jgi:dynactin 1
LEAEGALLQVEELRLELEDAHQQMAAIAVVRSAAAADINNNDDDAAVKAQAFAVQNARLREALLRLREQASVEKMEVSRQLRVAEKEAETGKALISEVESLRALKANLDEQIHDLKDMVEQGAAFEGMVEDLSDRILALEEDNGLLRSTVCEMEEAAELTEEMEEVQAEEMKALAVDLEGRDTMIRNLEEAIKM